jgi:hypothetical protein
MTVLDGVVDRVFGPWCQAVNPDGEPECFARVPTDQPGLICDDCWVELAEHGDLNQRIALAEEPELPPPAADILVADKSGMVRAALADNLTGLLDEHRARLASPKEETRILLKMCRRPDLSPADEESLMRTESIPALRVLAANPHTSSGTLGKLSSHPDPTVREAMSAGR